MGIALKEEARLSGKHEISAAPAPAPAKCGVIMPISPIDGCSAEHWADVRTIISQSVSSITEVSFSVTLVSDADDIGVIQKRIVNNIYDCDVIVCDVSCKNANVMFELGMRLAFDKPTVIVKDDVTEYSFDTGIIEHISYPRDLRFNRIISFKEILANKVLATYKNSQENKDHSTFLKNFGTFEVASIKREKLSPDQAIMSALSDLGEQVAALRNLVIRRDRPVGGRSLSKIDINLPEVEKYIEFRIDKLAEKELGVLLSDQFIAQVEERFDMKRYFSNQEEAKRWLKSNIVNLIDEANKRRFIETNS